MHGVDELCPPQLFQRLFGQGADLLPDDEDVGSAGGLLGRSRNQVRKDRWRLVFFSYFNFSAYKRLKSLEVFKYGFLYIMIRES